MSPLVLQLVARRKTRGWSQERLAKRVGVRHQQLSCWETGVKTPRLANLTDWAQALGLDLVLTPRKVEETAKRDNRPESLISFVPLSGARH